MARERRTSEETDKLRQQAKARIDAGEQTTAVLQELRLSPSVYHAKPKAVKKGKRRTSAEVAKLVKKIDKMRLKGVSLEEAAAKVGLARSAYDRSRKTRGGSRGSIRADQLPPRPKKQHGGKRVKGAVNMSDIASIAKRIALLDRKLRNIDGLVRERIRLVGALVRLLKTK